MSNKEIRLAGLLYESLANGPGIRRVLFSQGCKHNCKGCFNAHTHSFECGEIMDMDKIIEDIKVNPMLRGVTFSGGDPLEQADKFYYIAQSVREYKKDVWCYTGYTFEYILEHLQERKYWKELIEVIDVLIDGKYEESLKDENLKFRGSKNQRIIDVKESLRKNTIIVLNYD